MMNSLLLAKHTAKTPSLALPMLDTLLSEVRGLPKGTRLLSDKPKCNLSDKHIESKQTPAKPCIALPNFFLSIPIANNKELSTGFAQVQKALVDTHVSFKRTCIDPASAHVTLWVLRLHEDQVERVSKVMESVVAQVEPPQRLHLHGVGTFKRQVLFFDIEEGKERDKLAVLANSLRDAFVSEGLLEASDQDAFKPHVTVAKLSKLRGKDRKAFSKFPPSLVESLRDIGAGVAGEENPLCVRLCRIQGRKAGEYYPILAEVPLACK